MAALVTSCSDDIASDGAHKVSLSASVTAETTRAAFLSNGDFYWSTDDQIGVTTTNQNTEDLGFSALELKSGAGSGSATFEGTIVGGIGSYAVYPYNKDHSLNGTTLTYAFPASYEYTKVDQTFFPTSKDGNSYNPAMWASISDNNVTFKHLGGVFLISIEEMPYASGTLEVSSEANMAGKFTSDLSEDEPKCENTQTSVDDASKNVTITFAGATEGKPGVFYVPVPVGTYKNLTITFKSGEGASKEVVAGNYAIRRRLLKKLELKKVTIEAETAAVAESVDAVQNQLASNNNVELTAELEGTNNTITVPEVTTDVTTQKAKTVTLTKIADGASFELKDAASTTGGETTTSTSVKEITVSIPNVEDATKAPEVTVSMPNSTVTLAGNAGTATFKKVTASTAENTLVVSDGVTINELAIAKGNVRINKGATVNSISLATDNSSATVYYEDGATLPSTLPSGVTKKCIIETEAQFAAAMSNGGDYVLDADLTLSSNYSAGSSKTVTIDLNQKTLAAICTIFSTKGSNLTFKNGKITQTGYNSKICVDSNSTLVIDNVTYTGQANTQNCIFVVQNSQNSSLTVTNSKIYGGYYSVTTNASENPVATSTITLENSDFIANESGAMLNIPAYVTIKKCNFSGNHQGAFLRGGIYTIEDCTFKLNAELESSTDEHWMTKWDSGNCGAFAAVTIGNYLNTAYQYPTNITFKGTNKAEVSGTYAAKYPAMHVCANAAEGKGVIITGLSTVTLNQTKSTPDNGPEYGTDNITVDNVSKTANVTATTSTSE